ncbi:MAG TPA: type VI secretion system-associated protein TagF [Steroidobacteraceae bacterium]|jgi:type VI secretion system protein ImpM
MSPSEPEVGFYGKLPFKGDFLQRRVPQEFVDAWDAWLQHCLHESREQLKEAWLDAYLTGPIWRFVLAGGVCGPDGYVGVLVPSVDRVGRYFPLTVVARLDEGHCPLDVACSGNGWFEAAEAVALGALEAADMDIDDFDDQVGKLGAYLPAPLPSPAVGSVGGANVAAALGLIAAMEPGPRRVTLAAAGALQRAVNVLAYEHLTRDLQPVALWWSDGSSTMEPCWLSTRGLPDSRGFTAMLSVKVTQPS